MNTPTWRLRIDPIVKKGTIKLTPQENRIVAREVMEKHLNALMALLQLGFVLIRQRGSTYNLRHPSKRVTVSMEIDLESVPNSARRLVENFFNHRRGKRHRSEQANAA